MQSPNHIIVADKNLVSSKEVSKGKQTTLKGRQASCLALDNQQETDSVISLEAPYFTISCQDFSFFKFYFIFKNFTILYVLHIIIHTYFILSLLAPQVL